MTSAFLKNIAFKFNSIFHRLFLGDAGFPCKISPLAVFRGCRKQIRIGAGTMVFNKAYFDCDREGAIIIGKHCEIHSYARLMTYGGTIEIGDYCSVNPYSILYGHGGLYIGSKVRIAAHVVIIPGQHGIDRIDIPIMNQDTKRLPIYIRDDVWIGAGAKILGGVTIHTGAVVGANAVVSHDVPENAVVTGIPARVIRFRGENSSELMDEG